MYKKLFIAKQQTLFIFRRKTVLRFILPILLLTISANAVSGKMPNVQASQPKSEPQVQARQLDPRAKILADYFAAKDSPLQYQAQDFIDAADQYGVDWKLVPAISGVESGFGKASYGYNAWGWGIYGNQALGFSSWKNGIYTVTGGLEQNYISKGLTDPYTINKVYAASPTWGTRVNFFIYDLTNFTNSDSHKLTSSQFSVPVAGTSAQLALN